MTPARDERDADERALLALLPADGSPADVAELTARLGWDAERWASTCVRLEDQGYVQSGQGRAGSACRDLTAVPPEFRPACGHPGSHVIVREVPVTIPHASCDLTGVQLSYPGHGGAVTVDPGHSVASSLGFRLEVDARTLDVTITVAEGPAGNA